MNPKTRKKLIIISALITSSILIFVTGVSAFAGYKLVHPDRYVGKENPSDHNLTYEEISFKTSDDIVLRGWYINGSNKTIILAHGYTNDKSKMLLYARFLHNAGYSILLFDFRAHGKSGGDTSTVGFIEIRDMKAAVEFAKLRGAMSIGVLGHSMGGAVAIMSASEIEDIKAIVSDSAFANVKGAAKKGVTHFTGLPEFPFGPLTVWFAERFVGMNADDNAPEKYIGKISPRGVLLIQGDRDELVNPGDINILYNSAGEPKKKIIVPGAKHTKSYKLEKEMYEREVLSFFGEYL